MNTTPTSRRRLALGGTVVVFAAVLAFVLLRGSGDPSSSVNAADDKKEKTRDWPLFGGTNQRNLVNPFEKGIATEWSTEEDKEKNIKWSVSLGSKAYGGPTIANGKIYVGTNNQNPRDPKVKGDKGVVVCLRESDGKFLWQSVHDKLGAGRVNDWPEEGICSAAVVKGNRLFYCSNRCEVICATTEGKNGKADIVWTYDMIKNDGVFPHNLTTCSPLIVGNTIFIITANGVDAGHINIPAPKAPSFMAFDIRDKAEKRMLWKKDYPGTKIMHGQWSNPVYAVANKRAQIIFPGGDGWIYSLDPKDGSLIWKFDCNPKAAIYTLNAKCTRNDFVCTPVIYDNKLYIGVGQDPEHDKGVGHLWCIDITKTPKNDSKDVSPYSKPDDKNPKFDPKDPKNKDSALVWHYGGFAPKGADRDYIFGRTLSTCAVHDGLVYAAEFDGWLHCLDAKTGKLYWQHELEGDTWSSPYVVDGHVYLGNEAGVMHIFKTGKKKQIVRKIEMDGKIRVTPVACNGVLYMITENPCKLWAIKTKK